MRSYVIEKELLQTSIHITAIELGALEGAILCSTQRQSTPAKLASESLTVLAIGRI